MRHRATTRYKNGGKHRGKVISREEQARRIAQSFGFSNRWAMPREDYERMQERGSRPVIAETETLEL